MFNMHSGAVTINMINTRKALGERKPPPSNVNKNFKVIQNPGFLLDHPQNWTTCSFSHSRQSLQISERSFHNFL